MSVIQRRDVEFTSGGVTCRAWHFVGATDVAPAPCVVMGHGLGATRDCGLEPFARAFAAAGIHALAFDYRHFGASDGEPRQIINVQRQLEDWEAALVAARRLEGVDPQRIAAWGASFGGGHALVASARDGRVAAVVSLCPMADGLAAFRNAVAYAGLPYMLRVASHALRDVAGAALGWRPHTLPLFAHPGELAFLSAPDALPGYSAVVPPGFVNAAAARLALSIVFYRPVSVARDLRCPLLILVADRDSVAPVAPALRVAELAGGPVELDRLDVGHFDLYQGEPHERAVALMVKFLRRTLRVDN